MKKTRNKIFALVIVLLVVISGVSTMTSFVRDDSYYYRRTVLSVDFQRQAEFLRIMYNYTPGADSDTPNVVAFTVPETEDGIFLIWLKEEPTPEAIQIILDFTRIPYDKTEIQKLEQ